MWSLFTFWETETYLVHLVLFMLRTQIPLLMYHQWYLQGQCCFCEFYILYSSSPSLSPFYVNAVFCQYQLATAATKSVPWAKGKGKHSSGASSWNAGASRQMAQFKCLFLY